METDTVT